MKPAPLSADRLQALLTNAAIPFTHREACSVADRIYRGTHRFVLATALKGDLDAALRLVHLEFPAAEYELRRDPAKSAPFMFMLTLGGKLWMTTGNVKSLVVIHTLFMAMEARLI